MNAQILQRLADTNQWGMIAPELALACLALALLVFELVLPRKHHELIPGISIAGQLGILLVVLFGLQHGSTGAGAIHFFGFGGLIQQDRASDLMRVFFLSSSILVSILGVIALARRRLPKIEFFHIVLVVTAALMLLVQSAHFVMLFVALETVTVGFYVLIGYTRASALSLEAGLKYLIMGALSSALLLFGIVLLYGVVGNVVDRQGLIHTGFEFPVLLDFLAHHPDNFLAKAGIVLVLAGVAFKIGAVPFHIWIPDVYQGAPTPVTAFLAVASKAAGFALLYRLVHVFVPDEAAPYRHLVILVLSVFAGATIVFGNLAALNQRNVKRLIGLSGVSHAGYLLLGVAAGACLPRESMVDFALYFYLFAYLLASFAVFGVMTHLAGLDDADQRLDHYAGLSRSEPFLAIVLLVGLASLAGIPPLAGFVGKLVIFVVAFKARLFWPLALALGGVVVSIYYYFGWIKVAFFDTWAGSANGGESNRPPRTPVGLMAGVALAMLAGGSVLFGVFQGAISEFLAQR
jgi:NADH-quinone oxidoreductase subunit N